MPNHLTHKVGTRECIVLKKDGEFFQVIILNTCWYGIVHVITEQIENKYKQSVYCKMTIEEVIEKYNPDEDTAIDLRLLKRSL